MLENMKFNLGKSISLYNKNILHIFLRFYEWKRGKDSKQPYYIYFPQSKDSDLSKVKVEDVTVKPDGVKLEENLKIKKEDSGFCESGALIDSGDKHLELESYCDEEEEGLY